MKLIYIMIIFITSTTISSAMQQSSVTSEYDPELLQKIKKSFEQERLRLSSRVIDTTKALEFYKTVECESFATPLLLDSSNKGDRKICLAKLIEEKRKLEEQRVKEENELLYHVLLESKMLLGLEKIQQSK